MAPNSFRSETIYSHVISSRSLLVLKEQQEQQAEWHVSNPKQDHISKIYQPNTFSDTHFKLQDSTVESAYKCVGLNAFKCNNDLEHIASKVQSLKEFIVSYPGNSEQEEPQFMIFSWIFKSMWSKEQTCVVHLFQKQGTWSINEDSQGFEKTFRNFLSKTDAEKASQLRFATKMQVAPTIVKSAIDRLGGEKPVNIGEALTTTFHRGGNYMEIDINVSSSTIASMLSNTILKASGNLVVEECWFLQSEDNSKIFGATRLNYVDLYAAQTTLDKNYQA